MADIVITHALRTPIGKFMGAFREHTAVELGISLLKSLVKSSGLSAECIDELILGSARQAGTGPNPARQVCCGAGLRDETLAMTINQACGSGLRSIILGAQQIALGEAQIVAAGGMESMTKVPFLLTKYREGYQHGDAEVVDAMYRDGFFCPMANKVMGATIEDLSSELEIDREAQDAYALLSQLRCEEAMKDGRFDAEIAEVELKDGTSQRLDEHPRGGMSLAKLAKLPTVFKRTGTVTPGNASGITDGAAMVLLMERATAKERGLPILATLEAHASAGLAPAQMGLGPVPALKKLMERQGVKQINEYDLVEINEAFAAQVIACERALGLDRERLNVNGGAIALGHPIGATGARIVVTLLHEMARRGANRGAASLCVSGGFGVAAGFRRG